MMEILIGNQYRHKNSGNIYIVENVMPIKLDGIWHKDGVVIYVSEDTEKSYARITSDFVGAFEKI